LNVGLQRCAVNGRFIGDRGWLDPNRDQTDANLFCRARALIMRDQRFPSDGQHVGDTAADAIDHDKIEETSASYRAASEAVHSRPRSLPPFIPMHDIPRGILHGVQVLFSYTLMLVIM